MILYDFVPEMDQKSSLLSMGDHQDPIDGGT